MSEDFAFEPDEAPEPVEEVEEAPKVASGPTRRRIGGVEVDPETKEPLK